MNTLVLLRHRDEQTGVFKLCFSDVQAQAGGQPCLTACPQVKPLLQPRLDLCPEGVLSSLLSLS